MKALDPKQLIQQTLEKKLRQLKIKQPVVYVDLPTQTGFGDLTTNVALINFKAVADEFQSPRQLAKFLARDLEVELIEKQTKPIFTKIEVAGSGFINFSLSEQFLWQQALGLINQKSIFENLKTDRTQKVMVEFTDPNPFKELHIGHLYSNAVGETISRHLEALGHKVRRVCYQGDVGMHVAKTLWGWLNLKKSVNQLEKLTLDEKVEFLGQAYARGATAYRTEAQAQAEIKQLNYLVFIAAQDRLKEEAHWQPKVNYRQYLDKVSDRFDYQQIKQMYFAGRKWSLEAFEVQYRRLGTKFDDYFYESEVGEIGYEIVKRFLTQGVFVESEGAVIFPGEKYGLHNRVFINSLGLPTYEAKELGLAPTKYQRFAYDRSIIVTANEVDDYFKVLLKVMSLTLPDLAKKTQHISHGMVKLTTGKMSSRTGQVIKAKDLLDEIEKLALVTLDQREGLSKAEKEQIASKLAVAAVKFGFLRSHLGGDITFNPKAAVNLTGESGPYLQYSYVRTQSIWRQLKSKFGLNKSLVIDTLLNNKVDLSQLVAGDVEIKEIDLLKKLNQYFDIVKRSAKETKPHLVANYLFELAQVFSSFYESTKVLTDIDLKLKDEDPVNLVEKLPTKVKRRLVLIELVAQVLAHGLWLLGIETVKKM